MNIWLGAIPSELYLNRVALGIDDTDCHRDRIPENYNKSGDLYNRTGGFMVKPFHKSIFQ